jgi:hypothetical protein
LVTASDEIATNAFSPQGRAVEKILDEAEQKIFNIGEEGSRMKQGFQSMDTLVVDLMDRVQEMADNPNDITGVPTGFYDLDRMTSGLQAGDLVVLAARPSMGKTAFAINIAEHVALNEGLPVAVFSMEMGAQQLALRLRPQLDPRQEAVALQRLGRQPVRLDLRFVVVVADRQDTDPVQRPLRDGEAFEPRLAHAAQQLRRRDQRRGKDFNKTFSVAQAPGSYDAGNELTDWYNAL